VLILYYNKKKANLDVNSESAYLIDQNVQYYYQTTTKDGQLIMIGGKLKFKI